MSPSQPPASPSAPNGRLDVHVLGATGSVGQRFVSLLDGHPWFRLVGLTASERSAGRPYRDAVRWTLPTPLPDAAGALPVETLASPPRARLVFSALDADLARAHERRLAAAGHVVVTNASAHRLDDDVPLLIPEVNPDHLGLVDPAAEGALLANPNCTTLGLALAARPLHDAFGLERAFVTSLQAVSGAGLSGPTHYAMADNVLPHVAGEEQKLERELPRLLGRLTPQSSRVEPLGLALSATCTRVPVQDGHTLVLSLGFRSGPDPADVIEALRAFRGVPQELDLPSAPPAPVLVLDDPEAPQPKLHRDLAGGMATVVGRVRPCPLLDVRLVLLSHNTLRGAAGGALLVAELAVARRLLGLGS